MNSIINLFFIHFLFLANFMMVFFGKVRGSILAIADAFFLIFGLDETHCMDECESVSVSYGVVVVAEKWNCHSLNHDLFVWVARRNIRSHTGRINTVHKCCISI